jgi:hypothetical protein
MRAVRQQSVWHVTVFSKDRDRLLASAVAHEFFSLIVENAAQEPSLG